MAVEVINLRCPYCRGEINAQLEYTGYGYSEHRVLAGYECDSYSCGAEWDSRGNATTPGKAKDD